MSNPYKLSEEIKNFIISQKKAEPKLSCRNLVVLIEKNFSIKLSKSLINSVIKHNNLSSPAGRQRIREQIIPKEKISPQPKEFAGVMENGGLFFLKAADIKLGLISHLVQILSGHFPDLSKESHQAIMETLIYSPFFMVQESIKHFPIPLRKSLKVIAEGDFLENQKSLWLLVGKEVTQEDLTQYSQKLIQVPLLQLKESVAKLGIDHNFNEVNELYKKCLLRLNSYIVHFFPPEYQFLDFLAMQERFYCLPARLERKAGLLIIQLFYPSGFFWLNDIIWQEGFSYAANRVNEAKILTPYNEQIWLSPRVQFLEGNAFSPT